MERLDRKYGDFTDRKTFVSYEPSPGKAASKRQIEKILGKQNTKSIFAFDSADVMFNKDWNNLQFWTQQYVDQVQALRNQARRTRQDDIAVAASPAGGPNTIQTGAP